MSTMQTARTVGKGEFGVGFGGGTVNSEIALGDADTIDVSAPFLEVGARYGVTEKLDLGLKLTLIGTSVLDAKYQFIGDGESKFAGSVGLGAGYLGISSGDARTNIVDIIVPTYFSFHPNQWISLYASPKYILRINSYETVDQNDMTVNDSQSSSWYGATGGIRLGKRVAFLAEYSYFANSLDIAPLGQITAGIAIGIR